LQGRLSFRLCFFLRERLRLRLRFEGPHRVKILKRVDSMISVLETASFSIEYTRLVIYSQRQVFLPPDHLIPP
jgi:hypothetical protein